MAKQTGISWCDHTFNPWWGCMRVSEGCVHCYAETFAHRLGLNLWGPVSLTYTTRRFFGDKHWAEPERWNEAAAYGKGRKRVFCASMADVFEDAPGLEAERQKLWELIDGTPNLEWLLLTKRPENLVLLPLEWIQTPPKNVRVGITIENQDVAGQRLADLARYWGGKNFISVEPMLGRVSIAEEMVPEDQDYERVNEIGDDNEPVEFIEECEQECDWVNFGTDLVANREYLEWQNWRAFRAQLFMMERRIDWVIIGGESGASCRPMDLEWSVALREECKWAKVPVFVKQLGGYPNKKDSFEDLPEALRVREFPKEER